jgi:hypothetical protein
MFHSPHGNRERERERKNTKSVVEDQNNEKKMELKITCGNKFCRYVYG